jgi:hypothetical protein
MRSRGLEAQRTKTHHAGSRKYKIGLGLANGQLCIPEQANAGMNENSDEASTQRKKLVGAWLVRPGSPAYIESRGLMHGA